MRHVRIIDERSPHRDHFPVVGTPTPETPRGRQRHNCAQCRHHDCTCNWWRYYWDMYWEASPWGLLGALFTALLSLLLGPVIIYALLVTLITWGSA
jgi:hypothetical protein